MNYPQETLVASPAAQTAPLHSRAMRNVIYGTGEMADLTRAFDWSKSPVGAVEHWPEALLTTVNTLLESRHPMFLWWGADLVQFYNDGYRPSIREDKHPRALGQRGRECWPEIWPIIGPQIEAVMARGEPSWHENALVPIHRNGKLEDVYWTYGYSPVRAADGEICGTLVVCTETTQSILAKRQLQQERERLAALFQQAPVFFAVLDGPEFVFEMINVRYQELIGERNVVGKPVREAIPEAEAQGFLKLLEDVYRTGEPFVGWSTPFELARSSAAPSEVRYLDFVYQPRREAEGTISGVIALGVDVTENRLSEKALMQSEKLAVVGRLASSIAHEINNPLEAITNLIYLAQQAAVNPEARQYLSQAELEVRRVSAIANQTLRFYRQSTKARAVSAEDLVDGVLSLHHARLANSGVSVERRDRVRSSVVCFDGEIRQVLSNLIANAVDATNGRGGRLLVRSREGCDWSTGRRGIVFTIADTGSGMSATTLARMFEPFFTTKGMSGTGLGLWVSRGIVERHGGALRVRSRQGVDHSGTVFALFLPRDEAAAD